MPPRRRRRRRRRRVLAVHPVAVAVMGRLLGRPPSFAAPRLRMRSQTPTQFPPSLGRGRRGTGGPSTTHDDPKTKKDAKVGGGIKDRLTGQGKRRNVKTKAKRWPYDDYHKEQQKQYDAASKKSVNTYANDGPDSSFYERPDQLPSIKEAVSDLGLIDFEKKAEERAINIVSHVAVRRRPHRRAPRQRRRWACPC